MKTASCVLLFAACAAWGQKSVAPSFGGNGANSRFPSRRQRFDSGAGGNRGHALVQAAISPDGKFVAYSAAPIHIGAGDGKTACDEEAAAWSPDSSQIAFLSDCARRNQFQLYVAPAAGGPPNR